MILSYLQVKALEYKNNIIIKYLIKGPRHGLSVVRARKRGGVKMTSKWDAYQPEKAQSSSLTFVNQIHHCQTCIEQPLSGQRIFQNLLLNNLLYPKILKKEINRTGKIGPNSEGAGQAEN